MYQEVFGPDPAQCEESIAGLREKIAGSAVSSKRRSCGLASRRTRRTPCPTISFAPRRARARATICRWRSTSPRARSSISSSRRAPAHSPRPASPRHRCRRRARASPIALLEIARRARREAAAHSLRARRTRRRRADQRRVVLRRALSGVEREARARHCAARRDASAAGIVVGLGSDSMASNNRMDILAEARLVLLAQRARLGSSETPDAAARARTWRRCAPRDCRSCPAGWSRWARPTCATCSAT